MRPCSEILHCFKINALVDEKKIDVVILIVLDKNWSISNRYKIERSNHTSDTLKII